MKSRILVPLLIITIARKHPYRKVLAMLTALLTALLFQNPLFMQRDL